MAGPLAERTDEAGRDAKEASAGALKVADATQKKAEQADVAGDAAIEAAGRVLHELMSRAESLVRQAEEAAVASLKAAEGISAEAKGVAEIAREAAEEAVRKAEAALPRKVVGSWDFLLVVILIFLGAVTSSVLFSVALSYWH